MRIAIDARELIGTPTGVGRYLAQLLASWSGLADASDHEFILCAPEVVEVPQAAGLRTSTAVAPGHGTLWQQLTLPQLLRDSNADVLFAPGYTGPLLTRIPTVLSVHDVSFAAHPEWFGWTEGMRLRIGTRISARKAARVLTFSEFSKREIVRRLRVAPEKVEVTYHGVTSFAADDTPPGAAHTAPAPERLVLYVGSLFNRRHIPEIVDGFSRLAMRRPDTRLAIIGLNRTHPHQNLEALAAASPAGARIGIHSWVPDGALASFYRRAAAFVFLSDYEGFAMTPIEALAAGVPIVVLETEVAREIYGPAAVYVERPDPALIDAALERVLFDAPERARLLAAADAVLDRYSWRACAQQTLQALLTSAA
jgi:glycosyltransferase involved in cell wall biosynthesis